MGQQVLVDTSAVESVLAYLTYRNCCSYCGAPVRGILAPDQKHLDNCPAPALFKALSQSQQPTPALEVRHDRRGKRADVLYRGDGIGGQRIVLMRVYDQGSTESGQLLQADEEAYLALWNEAKAGEQR